MEIDRIRVSQLPSRYGIARSAVYTRLKDLQIEPVKEGRKAYVNNEQLQLLDSLHEHISRGGVTSDFLQQKGQQRTNVSGTDDSSALVQENPGQIFPLQAGALVAVLEAIVKRLAPSSYLLKPSLVTESLLRRLALSFLGAERGRKEKLLG